VTRTVLLAWVLVILTWLHRPVGAGFGWDAANGLGFLAIAAMGALHLERVGAPTTAPTSIHTWLQHHAVLGKVAITLASLHAFGLLALDPVVVRYLEPDAPLYMLAGIVALPALALMVWTATAPRRRRWHATRRQFRLVHRAVAAGVLALTAWHVLGSGFYFDHLVTQFAFAGLLVSWLLTPRQIAATIDRVPLDLTERGAIALLLLTVTAHSMARNL